MEGSPVEAEGFEKALRQAAGEYMQLFRNEMAKIKRTEERVSAVNMVFMRARDIERGTAGAMRKLFTFTITAFNLDQRRWDKCPGCGDPDINKESGGHPWQGCYKCEVLLGSNGTIKAMDPTRGKGAK